MAKKSELKGKRFGKLVVIEENYQSGGHIYWKCKCDCGNETNINSTTLNQGSSKSCGCAKISHGKSNSKIYHIWEGMINRCFNENSKRYNAYGGRGITVCYRWRNFSNFYNDMGDKPEGKSLDRINNDGDYEPLNCRWSTEEEQQINVSGKGYGWNKQKNKWESKIKVKGKRISLGFFNTPEEAREAYLEAKKYYHNYHDTRSEFVRRLHCLWDKLTEEGII